MGVHVVDLVGVDLAPLQCGLHGANRAVAVLGRGRDVIGITRKAIADDFGIDLGATLLGMLVLLEHDTAGAFPHHKSVPPSIKWPGSLVRVGIIFSGQGAQRTKTGKHQRGNAGVRS